MVFLISIFIYLNGRRKEAHSFRIIKQSCILISISYIIEKKLLCTAFLDIDYCFVLIQ